MTDTMLRYFDRDGNAITQERWGALLGVDNYHRVAFGQVTFDGEQLVVSTVWLGIDHNFSRGKHRPHIFETMVFGDCDFDQDCVRYSTEQDALEGHRRTMDDLAMGRKPWWL